MCHLLSELALKRNILTIESKFKLREQFLMFTMLGNITKLYIELKLSLNWI